MHILCIYIYIYTSRIFSPFIRKRHTSVSHFFGVKPDYLKSTLLNFEKFHVVKTQGQYQKYLVEIILTTFYNCFKIDFKIVKIVSNTGIIMEPGHNLHLNPLHRFYPRILPCIFYEIGSQLHTTYHATNLTLLLWPFHLCRLFCRRYILLEDTWMHGFYIILCLKRPTSGGFIT